ncbi:hypothetical protein GCM10023148_14550 [Actinokineospora soli]
MKTKTAVDEALARLTRAIDRPWDNGSLPSYEDKSTPVTRFLNRWTKPTPDSISGTLPTPHPRDPLYPTHDPDLPTPYPRTHATPIETTHTTRKNAPTKHQTTPPTSQPAPATSQPAPSARRQLTAPLPSEAAPSPRTRSSAPLPGEAAPADQTRPTEPPSAEAAPSTRARLAALASTHSASTPGTHPIAPATDRFPAISLPTARRDDAVPTHVTQAGHEHPHSTPATDSFPAISSVPADPTPSATAARHRHDDPPPRVHPSPEHPDDPSYLLADPPTTADDLLDDPKPPRRRLRIPRIAAVVAVLTGTLLAGFLTLPSTPTTAAEPPQPLDLPTAPTSRTLTIDVQGKVLNPGVHHLPEGSRIVDAIKASGGLKPGADTTDLNLARPLVDGEQIRVDIAPAPPPPADPATPPRANLNTAPVYQLDALPGVGIVTAQRIVEFRTRHGRFTDVAQLRQIEGIGPARFAKLKDLVTVD